MPDNELTFRHIIYSEIIPGTLAGIAQVASGHPFDTVKVYLQTQNKNKYGGMLDCFRKIIMNEGPLSLYKGATSPLFGAMFHNINAFFSYDLTKKLIMYSKCIDNESELKTSDLFLAGSISALPISLFEAPLDHIKCKMQIQSKNNIIYTNAIQGLSKIYSKNGFRGVMMGYNATLLRNAPSFGIYFSSYQYTYDSLQKYNINENIKYFLSGGLAGLYSWSLLYPFEVVKTRIQVDSIDKKNRKYQGIGDCFQKIIKNEGYSALWRGYLPTIIRAFPVNGCIFLVYHHSKKYFLNI